MFTLIFKYITRRRLSAALRTGFFAAIGVYVLFVFVAEPLA